MVAYSHFERYWLLNQRLISCLFLLLLNLLFLLSTLFPASIFLTLEHFLLSDQLLLLLLYDLLLSHEFFLLLLQLSDLLAMSVISIGLLLLVTTLSLVSLFLLFRPLSFIIGALFIFILLFNLHVSLLGSWIAHYCLRLHLMLLRRLGLLGWRPLSFLYWVIWVVIFLLMFCTHNRRRPVLDGTPKLSFFRDLIVSSGQLGYNLGIFSLLQSFFLNFTRPFAWRRFWKCFLRGYSCKSGLFCFWFRSWLLILSSYIYRLVWIEDWLCYSLLLILFWL